MNGNSNSANVTYSRVWIRAFSSLQITQYRWYFFTILTGFLTMQMQSLARGWLVYEMTASPLLLGLVTGIGSIPMILLTPIGGVIADHINKRDLIIGCDLFFGITSLILSVLITTGIIQIWHLVTVFLLTGIFSALYMPSRLAIIAEIVGEKHLMNAITLNSIGSTIGRVLGPSLAGILTGFIGVGGVYIITTVIYGIIIFSLFQIPRGSDTQKGELTDPVRDFIDGITYTYKDVVILMLVTLGTVMTLFGLPYIVLMPVFAKDILGLGATGLGFLTTASATGSFVGSIGLAFLSNLRRKGLLMLGSALSLGIMLMIFSLSHNFYLSCLILFLVGMSSTIAFVLNQTMIQNIVEPSMRGRVLSLFLISFGLQGIGSIPLGAIAEVIGVPTAVLISGGLLSTSLILVIFLVPRLRAL